jgi:hypothetical protein
MKKHSSGAKSSHRGSEHRLMRAELRQQIRRNRHIATKLQKTEELLTPKKSIKTEVDSNVQLQTPGIIASIAKIGIGKFSNSALLFLIMLCQIPLSNAEFVEEALKSDSSNNSKASDLSYASSIVAFAIPWLVYMYRSDRRKKVFDSISQSISFQRSSRSSDNIQFVKLEDAIGSELPQTAEEQCNKLMTIIAYLIDESKPSDTSILGSIKELIDNQSGANKSKLKEKISRIITPDNFAAFLTAYQFQRPSFGNTKKDQATLEKLDLILLKLATAIGLEEIYQEPETYQNHLEVTRNIEQVSALFKQFKEQPFGWRKYAIMLIAELYPVACVFASIPGFFNFVEDSIEPGNFTRPLYSAAISTFLVAAYAANSKYVQGLPGAVMKITDEAANCKEIFLVMLCGALAIAAASTGSTTQDLAGPKIINSTEKFFTGGGMDEFYSKHLFDSIFSATGTGLGIMSLGVASMSYHDIKDTLASAWKLQLPKELSESSKKDYAFIVAFPFLQLFAQFQTIAYCLTAFDKFKHYSCNWFGEELGEKVATGLLVTATMGRAFLVAKSFLFAQRRLYNEFDEHRNSFKKETDNLMKVFMALEKQELGTEVKNSLKRRLAENFEFELDQDLMKQLDKKRADPEFEESITKKGGIKKILQDIQNEVLVNEFQPLKKYQEYAEYGWKDLEQFSLGWGGLFANGVANAMTVSPKLIIPLSGGETIPTALRDISVFATFGVSAAICSRFLGLKTMQEREEMEKNVNDLIGNEEVRKDLIGTIIAGIESRLKITKDSDGDKDEVLAGIAVSVSIEAVKDALKIKILCDLYEKLTDNQKQLLNEYIYSKPSDSRVKSDQEIIVIRNEVISNLINDDKRESSSFISFVREKNNLDNTIKNGHVRIIRRLKSLPIDDESTDYLSESLLDIEESPDSIAHQPPKTIIKLPRLILEGQSL